VVQYAHAEVLVDTQWVAEHLHDRNVRLIDAHINQDAYDAGHIPGAVFWNGFTTILWPDYRVNFDKGAVERLLSQSGIATTPRSLSIVTIRPLLPGSYGI